MNKYLHTFPKFPQLSNKESLKCEKYITNKKFWGFEKNAQ